MRCVRSGAFALLATSLLFAATAASVAMPIAPSSGLTISSVFNLTNGSSANYFAEPAAPPSLVSDTVFGRDSTPTLTQRISTLVVPALFGASSSSKATSAAGPGLISDGSIIGVRFKLLGGEQTVAFQNLGSAHVAASPFQQEQAPALFAFYNYPQLSTPLNSFSRPPDLTVAAGYNGPLPQNSAPLPPGAFNFPLSNAFNAQGPNSNRTYALSPLAATVQLSFPIRLSKNPAKLRFAGQASTGIQPTSLATQIFGPAFAFSNVGKYSALGGGVTLALPVFDRKATVNLDGLYERLTRDDKTPTTAFLAANPGSTPYNQVASTGFDSVAAPTAVYFSPKSFDVKQYLGAASVAVPVTSALTVNGSFAEQQYGGATLNMLTQSLIERKTAFGGGLLYNIPKTNSSVNLFFNRYVYSNDDVPSYNRAENRQNLYFSVKF